MIYTVTLNPSVDYIVELPSVQLGTLNRTSDERKFPGGKGINVSRVLRRLNVGSKVLGYNGGFTGKYLEDYLTHEKIETDFVKVSEDTRINIKITSDHETEINARGPKITVADIDSLKEKIAKLTKTDLLVLAGSIPSSMPKTIYQDLAEICAGNGAKIVVDAEGELLKKILKYRPFLIKPNHHELGELFNTEISGCIKAIPYAKKLLEMGAENVIVSLAEKGALFVNHEHVFIAEVPKGQLVSSVGAGDSTVAGFLAKYEETGDYEEAFKYGVASGSATAYSIGICSKEKIEELYSRVVVKEK